MAGIYSILGIDDGDRSYVKTMGEQLIYQAAQEYLQMVDDDIMRAYNVLIEQETDNYKERYKLPGGGRMQRRGNNAANAAVRAYSGWDVAYPLYDFEEPVAENDVEVAYMTLADVNRNMENIRIRNINAWRYEMLYNIFNNTQKTFVDRYNGTLTIEPLANGDSVVYPPALGSETEATDDHYLEAGYLASAISDTNNPYVTIRDELEEHFGAPTGYGNIAVFIHPDQTPKTEALTDYEPVEDSFIRSGDDANIPTSLPTVPGRVMGRTNGTWVVEWRWVPTGYMMGLDLDAPAPLKVRRDPPETGITRRLHLSGETDNHPLYARHYRNRYGFGVGNRLNGVVMELANGGSYTVPTAYA